MFVHNKYCISFQKNLQNLCNHGSIAIQNIVATDIWAGRKTQVQPIRRGNSPPFLLDNIFKMQGRMAKELSQFIRNNLGYFQQYENVILYHDNGQNELNRILNAVLATELATYDFRKVIPSDYRLFQVADLVCTLELLKTKIVEGAGLSKSEQLIFRSKGDLRKDFLKGIAKKEFRGA